MPEAISPFNGNIEPQEKTPSGKFQDYANMDEIIRKSQTSKPFGFKKRTSQEARAEVKEDDFESLRKSSNKKSFRMHGSTVKRKNSQTESDIYQDLKSDILMQTHESKFAPSRR